MLSTLNLFGQDIIFGRFFIDLWWSWEQRNDPSFRSSYPQVFLGKSVLKICSKFTREHPCQSAISIKLLCNFINITSAWMFSCKFAAYFPNTFFKEHLRMAASIFWTTTKRKPELYDKWNILWFISNSLLKLTLADRYRKVNNNEQWPLKYVTLLSLSN